MHRTISSEPERFADSYFDMSSSDTPGAMTHCAKVLFKQFQDVVAWTLGRMFAEQRA